MYSKAKVFGHPVHPILVMFPVVFYAAALVAFVTYAATKSPFAFQVGVVANVAGVASALLAAVPGFVDWRWGVPSGHPAKAIGLLHMTLHVLALLAFAVNAVIQIGKWSEVAPGSTAAVLLSSFGVVLTAVGGYLGAEMVQRHHVGIDLTAEQNRIDLARAAQPARRVHPAVRGL
jgi:uncharacterized membrane protein